jgi:hypothetical protein
MSDCLFNLVFLMFLFVSIVKCSLRCTKEWTVAGLNIFLQINLCCSHIKLSLVASRILETENQRWTFECDIWNFGCTKIKYLMHISFTYFGSNHENIIGS